MNENFLEQNVYLLVTNDKTVVYRSRVPAVDYVAEMLAQEVWHFYPRTSYKNAITEGDIVLFYLAGQGRQAGHIVAQARVASDLEKRTSAKIDKFGNQIERTVTLKATKWFEQPVNLRENITSLSIGLAASRAGNKWGSILMGGAKKLTYSDYLFLTNGQTT